MSRGVKTFWSREKVWEKRLPMKLKRFLLLENEVNAYKNSFFTFYLSKNGIKSIESDDSIIDM